MLADQKDLAMYHTEEYLQRVLEPDTSRRDETPESNNFGLEEVSGATEYVCSTPRLLSSHS